jgi:large subunit ribosomal protein L23
VTDPYRIVKRPLVTEKNMSRSESRGVYTFEVDANANKVQIRTAVQKLFNVNVVNVRTATKKGLEKRIGYHKVMRADVKKAIVTLRKGEKIDII